jgi:SAM-dependent methyltransferase
MPLPTWLRRLATAMDPAGRRIRRDLHRVAHTLPIADRVLDLGSGRAPYARLFPHHQYVTADLFAAADVRCDACALPFRSGAFDLVLCSEVLEHVPDPDATLKDVRRVMRPGGALVLTTPLTWGVHEPRDYHRWTEMGLRQMLARHHFQVESLTARGGILLTLGSMLQVVPWQLYGDAKQRRPWHTALFVITYGLLLPLALALAALDGLDRRRGFTHGYVVLGRPWGGARPEP